MNEIPALSTFLIVCPLVFLAGFVDSIGGGGGLISLPAYMFAGLPMHQVIATNKLSAALGATVTTVRFAKNGLIRLKIALPSVVFAAAGSYLGAKLSLSMDEKLMERLLIVVLPVSAFFVLNRNLFRDRKPEEADYGPRTCVIACISAFVVGIYDGLYGPGTGTFLIIAFTVFAHMDITHANGQAKAINLATNIASLTVFLRSGNVLVSLGLAAAVCNMLGNYLGSGLAMKNGARIVRPVILIVLLLLLIRILAEMFF